MISVRRKSWLLGSGVALCLLVLFGVSVQAADDAGELRYQWKADQTLVYHVQIEVDQGDYWTILSGHPTYHVTSADRDGLQFRFSGLLNESQKPKPGKRILFRGPRRMSPFSPFTGVSPGGLGRTGPTVIKMNPRGEIISKTGSSQLPFLLGNLSELMLELLPEGDEPSWDEQSDISISLSSGRLPRPSFVRDSNKVLRAKQKTTYTKQPSSDGKLNLKKEFRLRTTETVQGEPRFEIIGSGKVVFDVEQGTPLSMKFEQQVIEREENTTAKTPLKITYRLLDEAERKKLAESRQVAMENLRSNKNTETTKLSDDDEKSLLEELDPSNPRSLRAVLKLQRQTPEEPNPDVAKALVQYLESDNNSHRYAAMKALENWATDESQPALLKSLDDSFPIVRHSAMIALARLNDEKAAEPIAARLGTLQDRLTATKALKAMGTNAEAAVLKQVEGADWQTRLAIVRILKEIGTGKSTETLKELESDSNALVKREAQQARKTIESRE